MMNRKGRIIFTGSRQSEQGMMSLILGILCVLSLLYSILYSYAKGGETTPKYGAALLLTLVFGIAGIVLGVIARRDENKFKLVPTIGIVINTLVVAVLAFLLWIGLR